MTEKVPTANISYFSRFHGIREDHHWYQGRERWDAITFIPREDITFVGFGLYEIYPDGAPCSIGWHYTLEDENGTQISTCLPQEEEHDGQGAINHVIHFKFSTQEPIFV